MAVQKYEVLALFNPSACNKRVTLQAPNSVKDSTGDPAGDTDVATTWAQIRPMSGAESFRAQQFTDEANITIVMRWRPGVKSNMMVKYAGPEGNREFQILVPLNEDEQNIQYTLLCKEIGP